MEIRPMTWDEHIDLLSAILRLMDKNPAPVDMLNVPINYKVYTSQVVVWDFFHQQYCSTIIYNLYLELGRFQSLLNPSNSGNCRKQLGGPNNVVQNT